NSLMTLEMREVLTHAQWAQLHSQRARVGANAMAGNLINVVPPVSPPGSQGTVVLEADINKDGTVEGVRVISGDPALPQAASDAVKQWRSKPTMLNGERVAVVTNVTVNFPFTGPSAAPAAGQRRGGRGPQ